MALSKAQRTDVRRYCGYPIYGNSANPNFGYRYFTQYGALEFRMTNMSDEEAVIVTTVYLANLSTLETAIVGASDNLDTGEASVWKHNKNEVRDRENLYNSWRRKLCAFLGVAPGPGLESPGLQLVV